MANAILDVVQKVSAPAIATGPAPTPSTTTPPGQPGDAAMAAAKKKSIPEQIAAQNRASTILTQGPGNPNALGG